MGIDSRRKLRICQYRTPTGSILLPSKVVVEQVILITIVVPKELIDRPHHLMDCGSKLVPQPLNSENLAVHGRRSKAVSDSGLHPNFRVGVFHRGRHWLKK